MLPKKIMSLQHPQVLRWAKLLKNRSYREECESVIVTGKSLVYELAKDLKLKSLMTVGECDFPASSHFLVTDSILKKITGLQSSDGFAAEIAMPKPSDLSACKSLLVLDQIADPGNLGTLFRTAFALGWEGVAMTPGTVDLFNDKAIRAAKGATFRLPFCTVATDILKTWNFAFYVADIEGKSLSSCSFTPPFALVLSNEARGPKDWTFQKISIPMQKGAESLNVAQAGAILLYEMRRS